MPQCRVPFVPAPFSFLLDQPAKEADFYIIWARKVEKYTHSKKNRRLKKTNTRHMLNFVLFHIGVSQSPLRISCGEAGNAFLFAEARPQLCLNLQPWLRGQKTASFIYQYGHSHNVVPLSWLCKNVSHEMFCILSQCLPDLHSNPAPCVCTRSSPGWRAEVAPNPAMCSSSPAAIPFQENSSPVSFKVGPRISAWTQVSLQ